MKLYLCKGSNGTSAVPLTEFGFVVSDEIMNGQYTHDWGEVQGSGIDAVQACCEALDADAWTRVPSCYLAFPTIAEDPWKTEQYVLDNCFNATPFSMARPENDGYISTIATVNEQTFSSNINWKLRGDGRIMASTPCEAENVFHTDTSARPEIRFTFVVLASESIVDGKFNFTTEQEYMNFTCSVHRIRAEDPLQSELWDWHTGQITARNPIPEAWLVLNGSSAYGEDDDPYSDDTDDSDTGGNDGDQDNWENGSGDNPEPSLPTVEATDAGFIELFCPTITQLKNLAEYMWSELFDLDTFKRLFADPMDCILGLSLVPANVTGAASTVNVGNINTGISMNKASSQYKRIDCGSIDIHENLKNYMDYSPYKKIFIFLPYIGTRELDIDMLNGQTLKVTYHIDVLTGGCTAYILVDNNVIENYSGQCSMNVPVTSRDWSSTINGICSLVSAAATPVPKGMTSAMTSADATATLASSIMNSKPTYEKSGNLGSSPGIMGSQKPFIIVERPRICKPARQNSYLGYPGFLTRQLSSLSGFTQVENIRLSDIECTDTERTEIMNLLKEGVIL